MKKSLIISLLLFIILVSLFNISYAAVTVTDEKLKNAFNKLSSHEITDNSSFSNITIDSINKKIIFKENNSEFLVNYNLSKQPTFTYEYIVYQGISYPEFEKFKKNSEIASMMCFLATAVSTGSSVNDSISYYTASLIGNNLSNLNFSIPGNSYILVDDLNSSPDIQISVGDDSKMILTSKFGDRAIEYVNEIYKNQIVINDNLYKYTIDKTNLTDTSCKIISTITINSNSAYSTILDFNKKLQNAFAPKPNEVLIIPPSKTKYKVGEKLDLTGLSITAIYDNNEIKQITKDYTVKGYNKNKQGEQTVTISYQGFSKSYKVQVGKKSSINTGNTNNNNTNTSGTNIEKLPQTGNYSYIKSVLYLITGILYIALIYIVYKSFKYNKKQK